MNAVPEQSFRLAEYAGLERFCEKTTGPQALTSLCSPKQAGGKGEGSSGVLVEVSAVSRCVRGVSIGQEVVAVAQTRFIEPICDRLQDISI